jgi:preprotein translocase subunit YajC
LIVIEAIFWVILTKKKGKQLTAFQNSIEENVDGKKVIAFTNPEDAQGGIFSKTYIKIDDTYVLRLRELMIPPEDLWD